MFRANIIKQLNKIVRANSQNKKQNEWMNEWEKKPIQRLQNIYKTATSKKKKENKIKLLRVKERKKHQQQEQQYLTMFSILGSVLCSVCVLYYIHRNSSFSKRKSEWMNEISFRIQKQHKEETELFTEHK